MDGKSSNRMKNNKVIIIGIDGATFDIIRPMIKRGELPTFKGIIDKGASGELMSTYPPHTVPAWPSCFTGVNPGKLGLFDFRENSHLNYDEGRLLFSTDIKSPPIWSILSERGKKVMIVAMPLTYPPVKVNGVMVSPVRLTEPDKVQTYPPELSEELFREIELTSVLNERRQFMDMHTAKVGSDLETFLDKTVTSSFTVIKKLTESTLYLLSRYEYDFGMFMLPVDALQHHLWCSMDQGHPSYNPKLAEKYKGVIFEGYKSVDEAMGRILNKAGDDATIILVSDHGFGPLHRIFYLNRWLIEQGLLKLKGGRPYSFNFAKTSINIFLQKIGLGAIARALPEGVKKWKIPIVKRSKKSIPELIDWRHTYAYATSYALNINLKAREPQGIVKPGNEYEDLVKHIKEELCKLKDPISGQILIDKVLEKREMYNGPYVEEAPDILFFFKDPRYSARKVPLYPDLFRHLTPEDRMSGHHTSFPEGICIMKGPHIIPGANLTAPNIVDITPTVLYLMGEALHEDMDGRVLTEAINKEYIKSHPIVKSSEGLIKKDIAESGILSSKDEEEIKKRLNELGYMG